MKILIVDDDKLTRKGLLAAMPWESFGMTVVGEASNGLAALEFLQNHSVDLVLTDLEMPLMSGMEFMRQAARIYPSLYFVILTIHSDFEYIQEALRMGAIDYIAKVQIGKENAETILGRIHNRVLKEEQKKAGGHHVVQAEVIHSAYIYAVCSVEEEADLSLLLNNEEIGQSAVEISLGIWLLENLPDPEALMAIENQGDFMFIRVEGVQGMRQAQLSKKLIRYKKGQFFYDYDPNNRIISRHIEQLDRDRVITTDEEFNRIKEKWVSFNWVHQTELFDEIKFNLHESKLTAAKILHIMMALENAWNRLYGDISQQKLSLPQNFRCWQDFEQWIFEVYETTEVLTKSVRFSNEVIKSIRKAQVIICNELSGPLHSVEIAARVNMSRSYFSQCFREIVGESFSDYLRRLRIEKAKNLLKKTNSTIQQVAEQAGYDDEKYFSRVFKKEEGISPSEYRRQFLIP